MITELGSGHTNDYQPTHSELAAPAGSAVKCGDCGESEAVITHNPSPVEWLLNRMCGIGEQWECCNCGHVWPKEKPQNDKAEP